MSLLSNQSFANPVTPLWALAGSGGSAGATGPTGPSGPSGPVATPSSRIILQVADGTAYSGSYVTQNFAGVSLATVGTDMIFDGTNKITFNTTGLYKISLNSGFANGEASGTDPGTTFWGLVYDETDTLVFDTTGTNGSGFNGSGTQNFIKVLSAGWYVLLVFRSSIPITYTSNLAPTLNADVIKVV